MSESKPLQIFSRRYEILCRLGEGGLGEVHRAHDRWAGRDVALKTLSAKVGQAALVQVFKDEFKLLAQLKHPGVVQALDFGYSEDTVRGGGSAPYFTMEFVEGKGLREACGDLGDPEPAPGGFDRLNHLVWQICDILEFLHLRKIVHCDLKPDNLKVTDGTFSPKILDFGLSEAIGSQINEKTKGTLSYMAPEMFKREPLDGRSDLYSLGIILYQLVTSRLPFVSDDPVKIVSAHLQQDPTPPSGLNRNLPSYLDEMILRLLEKSPDARPHNASQVKEMIDKGSRRHVGTKCGSGSAHEGTLLAHIYSGPMVGRETELRELENHLEKAVSQKGSCLFLSGEQGVGKTLLLRQLQMDSQLKGIVFVDSNCLESETLAYQPLIETLHKLEPYVEETCNARILSDLREIFHWSKRDPSSSGDAQISLHRRIARLLISISRSFPFVMAIQNLQWADLPTLKFLEQFQGEISKGRIFLCCSLCEEKFKEDTPRKHSIKRCLADKNVGSLKLDRFDHSKTRELICSKLIGNDFSSEFFTYVYRRTSGNPFFVVEVLKYLLENGLICLQDSVWKAEMGEVERSEVPATIEAVLLKNLERYDQKTIDFLSVLAVAGKKFTLRLSEGLGLLGDDHLPEALALLTRDQLLARRENAGEDEIWYEFANQSLQSLLYRRLDGPTRTRWHRRIAELLEDSGSQREEESVFEIAYHYLEGQVFDKAYRYALRCAEKMEQRFANDDVLSYLENAIQAASALPDESTASAKKTAALMKRAEFCTRVGELNQAQQDYLAVLKLTKGDSDRKTLVKTCNGLGEVCRLKHDYQRAIAYLKEAMNIHQNLNDPFQRAHTLSFLGLTYWIDSQYQQALDCFHQALEIDRSLENKFYEANTLNNIGLVHWSRRQYSHALEHFTDALSVYKELDNKEWLARTENNVGATLFEIGDYRRCIDHFLDSYRLNRETSNEREIAFNLENLCEAYRKVGDHSTALEYGLKGLKLAQEIDFTERVGRILKGLGVTHYELGEYEQAHRYFREARKIADHIEDRELQILVLIESGKLALTLNDQHRAARLLEEASEITKSVGDEKSLISVYQIRSSLKRRAGRFPEALRLLDDAFALAKKLNVGEEIFSLSLDYAELHLEQEDGGRAAEFLNRARESGLDRYVTLQPSFHMISARVKWMAGDLNSARQAFQTALELAQKLNSLEVLWRVRHHLGKLLLSSRDIEGAYGELKRAAAVLKRVSEGIKDETLKQNYLKDPEKEELLGDLKSVAKELVGEARLA